MNTKKQNIYRKQRYYTSSLDLYKGEILTMYRNKQRISEIKAWLKSKNIKVVWSTVYRFIKKNNGD